MTTSEKSQESGFLPTPKASDSTGPSVHGEGGMDLKTRISISSPVDSLVNRFLSPERGEVQMITAISGRKCIALLRIQGPGGLLEKMSEDLLLSTTAWYSSKCALIWREKVTPSSRLLFRLAPSMLHIDVSEYGLLPTPNTMPDAPNSGTNRGAKWGGHRNRIKTQGLGKIIKMLPTPLSRDYKSGRGKCQKERGRTKGKSLPEEIESPGKYHGLKLQPNFVEWMMGYPPEWTDLNSQRPDIEHNASRRSEIPSSPR